MTDLSPPEHVCDRIAMRRILATLVKEGGCVHCLQRVELWDKAICSGHVGRSWPLCMKDGQRPEFKLDEDTLR